MTKIKLTKTEQKILKLALQSPEGVVETTYCERTVSGYLKAIGSLRLKGLIQKVNSYTEWGRFRNQMVLYFTAHDQITDEGRQVLETIS